MDRLKHAFGIRQHVVVPEADHAIAERLDGRGSPFVARIIMLTAIKLDRKMCVAAGKIDDVRADRELCDEFGAVELASAQVSPQAFFGVGLVAPELARDRREAFFRYRRSPSPQPSPRRGEGVKRRPPISESHA